MAAQPIPNTIQVRLGFQLNDIDWAQNVLHYLVPSGYTVDQSAADAIAAFVSGAWTQAGGIQDEVSNQVKLASVGVRDIREQSQPEFVSGLEVVGASSVAMVPKQCCVVATLRTALAGRSYRGRIYWGGFVVAAIPLDGSIKTAIQTAVELTTSTLMSTTIGSDLLVLGVASRSLLETTPVTAVEVRDNVWDWQRSRED